jgi:hypothetical protein
VPNISEKLIKASVNEEEIKKRAEIRKGFTKF